MAVAPKDVSIAAPLFRWVGIARNQQGNLHFRLQIECCHRLEGRKVTTDTACYTYVWLSSDFRLGKEATMQTRIDFLRLLANELDFLIRYFPRLGMSEPENNNEAIRIFIMK